MKLSVETGTIISRLGDKQALRLIKEHGFDCVDYSYYGREKDDILNKDKYLAFARDIRSELDRLGLECNQAHAPMCFPYGDETGEGSENWCLIARAIESAGILGAKAIIVHSVGLPLEKKAQEFEYNVGFFKSFEPIAEKAGIKIAVETLVEYDSRRNRYSSLFNTPYELCNIVKALGTDNFTGCVDIGHCAQTNYSPEQFLRNMNKDILTCLHVQDSDYWGDAHFLPFTRDFKWDSIMQSLKGIGYSGDLTFEVIGYFNRLPNELLGAGLAFAESVGRHLISLYNS